MVAAGFSVRARWLDFVKDAGASGLALEGSTLRQEATNDIEDILFSDALLLLNLQDRGFETSGKAVETGIAIATLKPIIIVGQRTNVFHYLNIPFFPDVDDAIAWLAADTGQNYINWVESEQIRHMERMHQAVQDVDAVSGMEFKSE